MWVNHIPLGRAVRLCVWSTVLAIGGILCGWTLILSKGPLLTCAAIIVCVIGMVGTLKTWVTGTRARLELGVLLAIPGLALVLLWFVALRGDSILVLGSLLAMTALFMQNEFWWLLHNFLNLPGEILSWMIEGR